MWKNKKIVQLVLFIFISVITLHLHHASAKISSVGAIYFSTNDLEGNHVIVNSINEDGSLEFHSAIPTNGTGISRDSADIGSADSMIVGDDYLFVVNADSDSVSMFKINPANPTEIKLLDTVSSHGQTPTSLTYSAALRMLCVSNTGKEINGLACFAVAPSGLQLLPDTIKPFGLQLSSDHRKSVLGTSSDILFTADSTQVLVSIKGNPKADPPTAGIIASYGVTSPTSLDEPFVNSPVGFLPYSMTLVPGTGRGTDQAFIFTDPDPLTKSVYGLVLAQISSKGKITSGVSVSIPGQKLSCWSEFSNKTKNLFTIDLEADAGVKVGHGVISEFSVTTKPLGATMLKQYALQGPLIDSRIATLPNGQDFLYVLKGIKNSVGPVGIYVILVDTSGDAKLVQNYTPKNTGGVALNPSVAGLATYIRKH